jgi:hypothetical protein
VSAAQPVYVRTKAGRVHQAAVVNDRVLVDEACNLDQAPGPEEVLTQLPEDLEPEAFCRRCFPPREDGA